MLYRLLNPFGGGSPPDRSGLVCGTFAVSKRVGGTFSVLEC
jgi:hypothetical protein